jgi:outer membrane protein assembly factor BamA
VRTVRSNLNINIGALLIFVLAGAANLFFTAAAIAQAPAAATAPAPKGSAALHLVTVEGLKTLAEPAVATLTGLQLGAQVTRDDLQSGADHLLQTGLFSNVGYKFKTTAEGVTVTYHCEEAPRLSVYFDNFPWFADSELAEAIHAKLPFYDGHLPPEGGAVDQAAQAIGALLVSHGINAPIEHQPIPSPLSDGDILEFHAQGDSRRVASLTFSDSSLADSKFVQAHLPEIVGKEYSRVAIDIFLAEQIRPMYLARGYLRVKLGPPEIRLSGNPNQKLPESLPVFVPVEPGSPYQWKGVQWHGNVMLSEIALNTLLGEQTGSTANGQELEAGWDRIREQYGQKGYLDVKLDPTPTYDDNARTISYVVNIEEGPVYHFGKLVITGLSMEGEKRLTQAWLLAPGALFDKSAFEEFLTKLNTHPARIFGDLPLHFDGVGHYLQTDPKQGIVDVLLDFKH